MQDRYRRIVEIFLLRTAGPYIWVIFDRSGQSCVPVHVRFALKADLWRDKAKGPRMGPLNDPQTVAESAPASLHTRLAQL